MTTPHAWLPPSSCDPTCVHDGGDGRFRAWWRTALALLLAPTLPLLAVPLPGRSAAQRVYCRMMLRCLGVRVVTTGGPIRNLRGVLVVSNHISWLDIFVIGAVLPGSFVARADVCSWPGIGILARLLRVIPIERDSLRRLPAVVGAVTARLRAGQTVVAFPEATTFCGLGRGEFKPAMFQAAVDAARPVQPLRLRYRDREGRPSTVPAFVGDDVLATSFRRIVAARLTVAHVDVGALQLPGENRRDLARRCQRVVRREPGPVHREPSVA